jgi:hypothetical protein
MTARPTRPHDAARRHDAGETLMARGRKRKLRKRYANGQLVRKQAVAVDRGTAEMQAMRQQITKDQRLSPDYPLSVLLGRRLITDVQHDAGMKFAGNYWALFGKPFGRSLDYQQQRGDGAMTVGEELAVRAEYEAAVGALGELGAVSIVTDLAIFLRFDWLLEAVMNGETQEGRHERHLAHIRAALDALANLSVPRPRREERARAEREVA